MVSIGTALEDAFRGPLSSKSHSVTVSRICTARNNDHPDYIVVLLHRPSISRPSAMHPDALKTKQIPRRIFKVGKKIEVATNLSKSKLDKS